jgi:peptide/nickel transport system permease protein
MKLEMINIIKDEYKNFNTNLKIGIIIFFIILLIGLFAPFLTQYDPLYQDYNSLLLPPSFNHWFGTDNYGRDIFTRVIYATRLDLQIGFYTTYVPLIYGVMIGAYSGYFGGAIDTIMMRLTDTAMAFPFLILIIFILSILGPGIQNIYIAVFLVAWTMYARLVRAEMLVEKNKDYIVAAQVLGFGTNRIIFKHAMPNIITSCIIFSMFDFVLNSSYSLLIPRFVVIWASISSTGIVFLRTVISSCFFSFFDSSSVSVISIFYLLFFL